MNSNEMSRYFRWAIPGWVAIISCFIFIVADIMSTQSNHPHLFDSITEFIQILGTQQIFTNALLVSIAGIPLGFIICQFYDFIRWNSPFPRKVFFPPLIQGRLQNLDEKTQDFSIDQLSLGGIEWRKDWLTKQAYRGFYQFRWQYIESLLTEILQKLDGKYSGLILQYTHRYLNNLMVALGASLGGLYIGFITYLIVKVRYEDLPITNYAVMITVGVFILIFLMDQEGKELNSLQGWTRRQQQNHKYGFLQEIKDILLPHIIDIFPKPSIMLGIFSGMIIFFVSPSILANQQFPISRDYIERLLFVAIPIFGILYKTAHNGLERLGVISLFILGITGCFLLRYYRDSLFTYIDWSFTGPFFTFMTMNLVLLKSYQNLRNELIAFEYYTLKRYLMEEQEPYIETSDIFEINYSFSWPHRIIYPGNQEASLTRPENTK